jgi:hypothetical protein
VNPSAWKSVTWDGNRAAQHQEFRSLSFREKLLEIERMDEVAEFFEARRLELGLPVRDTEEGAQR